MSDDEGKGIRGDELADEAGADGPLQGQDEVGKHGVRGDGLADDAAADAGAAPDPAEAAEGGIRGDGLATDA